MFFLLGLVESAQDKDKGQSTKYEALKHEALKHEAPNRGTKH
jgi:hypothetical protein